MFELLIKALIALCFGLALGYLFRVFSRRKLGTQFDVAPSKKIQVDNFVVNFVQAGHGPDLLLIHGIGASVYCWRLIFRHLTKNYRVTAIDLPGFGASEKNPNLDYGLDAQTSRVARIVEVLGLGPTYILGSSMGGLLGIWLLKTRPELVKGLATIAPAAHQDIVGFDTRPMLNFVKLVGRTFVTPFTIEKILRRIVTNQNLVTAVSVTEYYRPYADDRNAPVCFWKAQDTLKDNRIPLQISHLEKPILILYGLKDRIVKKRFIDEIFAHVGRAELVEHPSGGHHLMEDAPDFVTENIDRFFGSTKAVT